MSITYDPIANKETASNNSAIGRNTGDMKGTMTTFKNVKEAYDNFKVSYDKQNGVEQKPIDLIAKAVNKSKMFRDYVMGDLPTTYGTEQAVQVLLFLMACITEEERSPFYTILSSWYWELGDMDLAWATLYQAMTLDPQNELATLFGRCFNAKWESENFAKMRDELHPKVKKQLAECEDLELV